MTSTSLPSWDLSDLYTSTTDPRIEKTFLDIQKRITAFVNTYRGRVASLTAAELAEALHAYEWIGQDASKPEIFAHLLFSTKTDDPVHGAFLQRVQLRTVELTKDLIFFDLELGHIPPPSQKHFLKDPLLRTYRHHLERAFAWQKHHLTEAEEKLLGDKDVTGKSAFRRLFSETTSSLVVADPQKPSSKKTIPLSAALDFLHDPRRTIRKSASEHITAALETNLRIATSITNTLAFDKATDDRYRKFPTPESARHLSNDIRQTAVDALVSSVESRYTIVQDFYRFKKRVLGLDALYDYDRYAPIQRAERRYSFEEAKTIILESYRAFSPVFADLASDFFTKRWIDAAARPGKRGGAYCMFVGTDAHPYVFMNFTGTLDNVKTLGHELGHAIHACLARVQTPLNFDMPLTLAETASVFGEMLVFDTMRRKLADRPADLFALYMEKIESIFATVFRQISMFSFERELHEEIRHHGEMSADMIGNIWRTHQERMFGKAVTITPGYNVWWSYIPHFVDSPFYVYAYAFGELLTLSLYNTYRTDGSKMVDAYIAFLSAGGSDSPENLLKPLGMNLNDPEFWNAGLDIVEELIQEAKRLYKKI